MLQKRSPALQQYLSQLEPHHEQNVGFENVLPLFSNQEIVRPTTFRPPTAHRFAAPIARSLFQNAQPSSPGVQIQPAVSLTPEPIVFTQIGNSPLQRVFPNQRLVQASWQLRPEQESNQPQPSFIHTQQNVIVQQNQQQQADQQQRYPMPSQIQEVPNLILQPSLNYVQQVVAQTVAPGQQPIIQPPSQYLQIPNDIVPQIAYNTLQESLSPPEPVFYQRPPLLTAASNTIQQQILPQRRDLRYLPTPKTPVQDLPNPYQEFAERRSFEEQNQQQQFAYRG